MHYDFLNRNITLERLQTFLKIAQLGSIAEAAERDPTRQSQYSRQIKELESALETRLFDQQGRGRVLNENGRQLALLVDGFFAGIDDFTSKSNDRHRVLRIGAGESVHEGFLFPKLGELHSAFPDVQFQFQSLSTGAIQENLLTGRLDIGVMRGGDSRQQLQSFPVGRMSFQIAMARSLLTRKVDPDERDLLAIPWALLGGDGRVKSAFMKFPLRMGSDLRVIAEAQSYQQLHHYVELGIAAAILPMWLAEGFAKDLYYVGGLRELDSLEQSLELIAHSRTLEMRPFVETACGRISRILQA